MMGRRMVEGRQMIVPLVWVREQSGAIFSFRCHTLVATPSRALPERRVDRSPALARRGRVGE